MLRNAYLGCENTWERLYFLGLTSNFPFVSLVESTITCHGKPPQAKGDINTHPAIHSLSTVLTVGTQY